MTDTSFATPLVEPQLTLGLPPPAEDVPRVLRLEDALAQLIAVAEVALNLSILIARGERTPEGPYANHQQLQSILRIGVEQALHEMPLMKDRR